MKKSALTALVVKQAVIVAYGVGEDGLRENVSKPNEKGLAPTRSPALIGLESEGTAAICPPVRGYWSAIFSAASARESARKRATDRLVLRRR